MMFHDCHSWASELHAIREGRLLRHNINNPQYGPQLRNFAGLGPRPLPQQIGFNWGPNSVRATAAYQQQIIGNAAYPRFFNQPNQYYQNYLQGGYGSYGGYGLHFQNQFHNRYGSFNPYSRGPYMYRAFQAPQRQGLQNGAGNSGQLSADFGPNAGRQNMSPGQGQQNRQQPGLSQMGGASGTQRGPEQQANAAPSQGPSSGSAQGQSNAVNQWGTSSGGANRQEQYTFVQPGQTQQSPFHQYLAAQQQTVTDVPMMPLSPNASSAYRAALRTAQRGGTAYWNGNLVLPNGNVVPEQYIAPGMTQAVLQPQQQPVALDYRMLDGSADPLVRYLAERHRQLVARRADDRTVLYQLIGDMRDGATGLNRGGMGNMERGEQQRRQLRERNARLEGTIRGGEKMMNVNLTNTSMEGDLNISYVQNGEPRRITLSPNHLDLFRGDPAGVSNRYLEEDGIIVRLQYGAPTQDGRPVVTQVQLVFTKPGAYEIWEAREGGGVRHTNWSVLPAMPGSVGQSPAQSPSTPGQQPETTPAFVALNSNLQQFETLAKTARDRLLTAETPGMAQQEAIAQALKSTENALEIARIIRTSPAYTQLANGRVDAFRKMFAELQNARMRLMRLQLGHLEYIHKEAGERLAKRREQMEQLQKSDPTNAQLEVLQPFMKKLEEEHHNRAMQIIQLQQMIEQTQKLLNSN